MRKIVVGLIAIALSSGCSTFAALERVGDLDHQILDFDDAEWAFAFCGMRRARWLQKQREDPPLLRAFNTVFDLATDGSVDLALLPIMLPLDLLRFQRLRREISERRHEAEIDPPVSEEQEGLIIRGPPR